MGCVHQVSDNSYSDSIYELVNSRLVGVARASRSNVKTGAAVGSVALVAVYACELLGTM